MTEFVVIGGGAAGLFAAGVAARRGLETLVLEPGERLGSKLRISGKGRCNLTNDCSVPKFLENVPGNPKFLQSALHRFPPAETLRYFNQLGVPLKVERGARVFPVSDSADEVADALVGALREAGARVRRERALRILSDSGRVAGVETAGGIIPCRAALLCTGGLSYPGTGSGGDGYRMAAALGHTIKKLRPSLVPLLSDDFCAHLQGLSLRNVTLSAYDGEGRLLYRELGEMLFTHYGVSGPLVLSASAHMRALDEDGGYRLSIDLKPGLDEKKLDERLLRDFADNANRDFKNALDGLFPKLLIPVMVRLSGIPGETKVNAVTRQQRRQFAALIKDFPLSVRGARPVAEAIVTAGGVSVAEVNPRTMESRLLQGLYFAGEILDVDAYTGGFNLQIAWSTAYTAAMSIAGEEQHA
jgi:predicted Rossmann fold flavoprotein